MQLTDALSSRDKETIKHYIQLYTEVAEPAPLSTVLKVWNKQKRTLYKALGNNLRVRIPVEIPRNALYYQRELKAIYEVYTIWDYRDADYFLKHQEEMMRITHNKFVFEYLKFVASADWCNTDKYNASRLILHQNIENGYLSTVWDESQSNEAYHFKAFKSTIKNNMRTVRTIQKVLKGMNFPYMDLFEKWRNAISDININRDIKADLIISIHPIDFMSMSDNNCDWTSCMSWAETGAYSSGTIEMMNSNVAVICYLESKTPFYITFDNEKFYIPNKSWRTLVYVHKDIIVAGKAYPYFNEELSKRCLTELRKLVKKNLNWEYQYINQPYKDNQNIDNNFFLKSESVSQFDRPKRKNKKKHAIYLYTNCMYNDLIEYKDTYWCCRNWVPRTFKICLSGPATCMCCGEKIEEPAYICSYDEVGSKKICTECYQNRRCTVCDTIKYQELRYTSDDIHICSEECLKETVWVPALSKLCYKTDLTSTTFFVVGNEPGFINNDITLSFIAHHSNWWNRRDDVVKALKNNEFFAMNAKIFHVPKWAFYNSDLAWVFSPTVGYKRRESCKGHVLFFDKDETFKPTGLNIFEIMDKLKEWVPAEEVV